MSIVIKIGGSNLHDAQSLVQIKKLVTCYKEPVVLVVSAFHGLTDRLYDTIREDELNNQKIEPFLKSIRQSFEEVLYTALTDTELQFSTIKLFHERLARLGDLLKGIALIGGVPDFIEDEVVSFGERISSLLISAYLEQESLPAAEALPELIGLYTDGQFHNANVDFALSAPKLRERLSPDKIWVVPGFYGISQEQKITVFGRGGSDYSAAALAKCIGAQSLDVWKDVKGYLSGDPTIINKPVPIAKLSYTEAAELSYFGAKILHPRTVEPLKADQIPVRVFNFLQVSKKLQPFSVVGGQQDHLPDGIKSVTYSDEVKTLTVRGPGVGITPGILNKITNGLEQNRINIRSVITSQVAISLLLNDKDVFIAHQLIERMSIPGIDLIDESNPLSLIAAVGEGVLTQTGLAAKIFSAVAKEKINVDFISFGASRVAIYFLVNRKLRNKALLAIHDELFN